MKYGIEQQLRPADADMAQRFHAAMLQRLHQYQAGATRYLGNALDVAIIMMEKWTADRGECSGEIELDAAGVPKLEPTLLELQAIQTLNSIKAWADDGGSAFLPPEICMRVDVLLLMAAARRRGVR